jgi:hypothetical protein
MSTQLRSRLLSCVLVALGFTLSVPVLVNHSSAVQAASNTYAVNDPADLPDANQGDNICAAVNGKCTLRAAIMEANFDSGLQTITVPSGVYVLTRYGREDNAVTGDLDIADDLTIQGAGSGVTIVDGNGAMTGDRVFQILNRIAKIMQ